MKMNLDNLDGIIWDMDGVLVDVSKSYREAIRFTASYILQKDILMHEVDLIKKYIGLNNDWDATFILIKQNRDPKLDVLKSIQLLKQERGTDEYILVKDIFQSVYLGRELFTNIYKRSPKLDFEIGLINSVESLNLDKTDLLKIRNKYSKMAIATGRPKIEAFYTLEVNNILNLFDTVVCIEDTLDAKPSPEPILKVIKELNLKNTIYIGDSSSDVVASKRAGIPSIYIGVESLGDISVKNISELLKILL